MLEIKNLSKSFGELQVLRDISLNVKKGEVVAIIGPSGTGKSTLLRCINYLEKPDSGYIRLGDFEDDLKNMSKHNIYQLRRRSCMVFQAYHLFKNKTALENVMEGLLIVQKKDRKQSEQIALDALQKVGMIDKKDAYPSTLSGGQQQRVGIARALALKPDVILFDEPTSALDPELVGEVLRTIRDLKEMNITMMIVTHEIHFAGKVSDRVLFMSDGEIVEQGEAVQVLRNPVHERTKKFLNRVHTEGFLE